MITIGALSTSGQSSRVLTPSDLAKLDSYLAALALDPVEATQSRLLTTEQGPGVVIDAAALDGNGAALLAQLTSLGLQHGASFGGLASGVLPISAIAALPTLSNLGFAQESLSYTNAMPIPDEGSGPLHADTARSTYGVDGTGIKIGVLSDSFNTSSSLDPSGNPDTMETDIANGYLPADTQILNDFPNESDEGRAMAQLIHQIAPGASILFDTAFGGQAAFAQHILDLAAAGAKIIVDDITTFGDPAYQNGVIAQAINQVESQGVAYFSSAGNGGQAGYEGAFDPGVSFSYNGQTYISQTFDNTGNNLSDSFLPVTVEGGVYTDFALNWDQPAASASPGNGATGDLDLFLIDAAGNLIFSTSDSNIGKDPLEDIAVVAPGQGPQQYYLRVGFVQGTVAPTDIKIVPFNADSIGSVSSNYNTGSFSGHASTQGAIAVGAVSFRRTPQYGYTSPLSRDFSASGPNYIYYDDQGHLYQTPLVQNISISATDGLDNSFFGVIANDGDNFPNFVGTSAAAPVAAAVAALLLQKSPSLTPSQIRQILENSALPTVDAAGNPSPQVGGAGLIQADAALASAPCYCRGTRILTERGEVVVEDLKVGDMAVTASGERRPIVWIGHRAIDITRHPEPAKVWPVRVEAGAFGDNSPSRDLWMSPGHKVAFDGVLIPVKYLLNGRTVAQVARDNVEYWHVELDRHDILLADNLPAESYLDTGNRTAFANGGAYLELHPDFEPRRSEDTCAPLVKAGPEVSRAKAALLERAKAFGHETTTDADLHIMADGRRIEPIRRGALRFVFVLPPDRATIEMRSRGSVPAETQSTCTDTRLLGVCVKRLQVDGKDVALDDTTIFGEGWHGVEQRSGQADRRWTRGQTLLPAGTRLIVLDLAKHNHYWADPVIGTVPVTSISASYTIRPSPAGLNDGASRCRTLKNFNRRRLI